MLSRELLQLEQDGMIPILSWSIDRLVNLSGEPRIPHLPLRETRNATGRCFPPDFLVLFKSYPEYPAEDLLQINLIRAMVAMCRQSRQCTRSERWPLESLSSAWFMCVVGFLLHRFYLLSLTHMCCSITEKRNKGEPSSQRGTWVATMLVRPCIHSETRDWKRIAQMDRELTAISLTRYRIIASLKVKRWQVLRSGLESGG